MLSLYYIVFEKKCEHVQAVDLAMEEGNDVKATVAAVRASEAKYVPPRAAAEMAAMPLPRGELLFYFAARELPVWFQTSWSHWL